MAKYQIDTKLAADQLVAMQTMRKSWGDRAFMATMFWILSKFDNPIAGSEVKTKLIPFWLNLPQTDVYHNIAQNNIIGKPRQSGFTTFLSLFRLLLPAITDGGIGCLLISQSGDYVSEHFRIIQRAHKYLGVEDPRDDTKNDFSVSLKANLLHTAYSNRKELVFDYLDSKVRVASAEVEESGQGLTLHHILASEYARWPGKPEATLANVRGALAPGGTVDKESTANGATGPFFEDCMRAMEDPANSDSKFHYHGWHWVTEYRKEISPAESKVLMADLKADEIRLIALIHKELGSVAYVGPKPNRVFVP